MENTKKHSAPRRLYSVAGVLCLCYKSKLYASPSMETSFNINDMVTCTETEQGLEVKNVAMTSTEQWVKTPREAMKSHGRKVRAGTVQQAVIDPSPAAVAPAQDADEKVEHQTLQDLIAEVKSAAASRKVA
jgi:succinylarginine dihydrolase